jgi:MoaA/NifB/PqqE/SkfB family radical SAM enzyme
MEMPLDSVPLAETYDDPETGVAGDEPDLSAESIVDLMLTVLSDGLDHPELWEAVPGFVDALPDLVGVIQQRLNDESRRETRASLLVLLGICGAAKGHPALMAEKLEPLAVEFSQSPLVQGALFHLQGLADPDNPKYALAGKICPAPFVQIDVLERSSHLCCASWLQTSAGDMSKSPWEEVWNSETAQAIRESIHDGSYRYCNKGACPKIQANDLMPAAELAAQSDFWRALIESAATAVPRGPEIVNLAYDRTCNLACPSCRVERFAADEAQRASFDEMQERTILPLLKGARTVFVTGSGDPFASKNFRRLMEQLTPEDYPELGFQIMTNGMLFTERQWENFPALHRRVKILKISIDAATGPTHELLRRGARWPVMLENMAFAGGLTARGEVDHFELVFTVQAENYREMGDAVDLARSVGATGVYFARITNWGTFTDDQYRDKAVFLAGHAEHGEFLRHMQDPRLRDPMVLLGDLHPFVQTRVEEHRKFQH